MDNKQLPCWLLWMTAGRWQPKWPARRLWWQSARWIHFPQHRKSYPGCLRRGEDICEAEGKKISKFKINIFSHLFFICYRVKLTIRNARAIPEAKTPTAKKMRRAAPSPTVGSTPREGLADRASLDCTTRSEHFSSRFPAPAARVSV